MHLSFQAMPDSRMHYKAALQLHKLYNATNPSLDWISLNIDQILTTRQTVFQNLKSNKTKVGLNILTNKFAQLLNGKIPLQWLLALLNTFKVKCKKLFLEKWTIFFNIWLTINWQWHCVPAIHILSKWFIKILTLI